MYKDDNGTALLEVHKNQAGKGIPKFLSNRGKEPPLMDLLEGRIPIEHFDAQKVKSRIIQECLLEEKCAKCDFMERRVQMTDESIFNDTSMTIKNAIQNTYDNNSSKTNISKTAFEVALKQLV